MITGKQLATKDGRKVGNAIISSLNDDGTCEVLTDFGNKMTLNLEEIEEFFYTDFHKTEGFVNFKRWIDDRDSLRKRE